jgi:hypothetical protein
MEEFSLRSTEIRRFESPEFAVPFEVECSQDDDVVERISSQFGKPVFADELAAEHVMRLISRLALTGNPIPPLGIASGPGGVLPLDMNDIFRLGLSLSGLEKFPTRQEYDDGSAYLRARAIVEGSLNVSHIHLEIREGEEREAAENAIVSLSQLLGSYEIAYGRSPQLGFVKFVELLEKNRKVFAFPAAGNLLLGTTAIGAAYQIAILANPVLAIQLAAGGAAAYVLIKFGAAVGKRLDKLMRSTP